MMNHYKFSYQTNKKDSESFDDDDKLMRRKKLRGGTNEQTSYDGKKVISVHLPQIKMILKLNKTELSKV